MHCPLHQPKAHDLSTVKGATIAKVSLRRLKMLVTLTLNLMYVMEEPEPKRMA